MVISMHFLKKRSKVALTMAELAITIAVMGILSAVVVVSYKSAISTTESSVNKAVFLQYQQAFSECVSRSDGFSSLDITVPTNCGVVLGYLNKFLSERMKLSPVNVSSYPYTASSDVTLPWWRSTLNAPDGCPYYVHIIPTKSFSGGTVSEFNILVVDIGGNKKLGSSFFDRDDLGFLMSYNYSTGNINVGYWDGYFGAVAKTPHEGNAIVTMGSSATYDTCYM